MKKDTKEVYIIDKIDQELSKIALENSYCITSDLIFENYEVFAERAKKHEVYGAFIERIVHNKNDNKCIKDIKKKLAIRQIKSRKLLKELGTIHAAFKTNGIKYVVFKGIASVFWKCCSLTEKVNTDFDLLIMPEDLEKAYGIVATLGYKMAGSMKEDYSMRLLAWHGCTWHKGEYSIEIHHRYDNYGDEYKLDAESILKNLQEVSLQDVHICVPAVEDQLLLLCIHMYHHEYRGMKFKLKYQREIDNLIKNNFINWDMFKNKVHRCDAKFVVSYALYFCNETYELIFKKRLFDKTLLDDILPEDFDKRKNQLAHRQFLDTRSFGDWDEYIIYWEKRFGYDWKGGYAQRLFSDENYVALRFFCLCFYYSVQSRWRKAYEEFNIKYDERFFY